MSVGVTRLASGRFRWRAQRNGLSMSGVEDTEREAVEARAAAVKYAETGQGEPTISGMLATWLDNTDSAATTRMVHEAALGRLPASFTGRMMSAVEPADVARLWRTLSDEGVSEHTQQKAQSALSQAWQLALRWGVTGRPNPFHAVRVQPAPADRVSVPTVETVKDLLRELGFVAPELSMFARVMAVTGARPGEVCALKPMALQGNLLELGPSINLFGETTDGKNGRKGWRRVALDPETLEALELLVFLRGADPDVWLFGGQQPWRPADVSRRIMRVVVSEQIPLKRVYDLRHFAASQALANGATNVEVGAMLGDNPATVSRVYAHLVEGSTSASLRTAEALA